MHDEDADNDNDDERRRKKDDDDDDDDYADAHADADLAGTAGTAATDAGGDGGDGDDSDDKILGNKKTMIRYHTATETSQLRLDLDEQQPGGSSGSVASSSARLLMSLNFHS